MDMSLNEFNKVKTEIIFDYYKQRYHNWINRNGGLIRFESKYETIEFIIVYLNDSQLFKSIVGVDVNDMNLVKSQLIQKSFDYVENVCLNLLFNDFNENGLYRIDISNSNDYKQLVDSVPFIQDAFRDMGMKVSRNYLEYNTKRNNDTKLIEFSYLAHLIIKYFNLVDTYSIDTECSHSQVIDYFQSSTTLPIVNKLSKQGLINHVQNKKPPVTNDHASQQTTNIEIDHSNDHTHSAIDRDTVIVLSNKQWSCSKCTYLNDSDQIYCAICNYHKNDMNARRI